MSAVILRLGVIAIPIGRVLSRPFSRMRGDNERVAIVWIESIGLLRHCCFGCSPARFDPARVRTTADRGLTVLQILSIYVIIRRLQAWDSIVLDAAGKRQITM